MSGGHAGTVSVVDSAGRGCPEIPIVVGGGNAKVVTWPGTGATHRTFHLVALDARSRTIPLRHAGESVYYVISGQGAVVDLDTDATTALAEGAMVHIGKGDSYRFQAEDGGPMTILGGPCPADNRLYDDLTEKGSR